MLLHGCVKNKPMIVYREFSLLKFYLIENNYDVTSTNDKYEIYKGTKKCIESESVDSFDVHSGPLLEVST